MKVKVYRSAEWVRAQRVERAANVPEAIEVEIDPAGLNTTARQTVLASHHGRYPDALDRLSYDDRYEWTGTGNAYYGYFNVRIDSDSPSVEDINRAILFAAADLLVKRTEKERKEQEREEAARRLKEARELLADDLANKDREIAKLKADRALLADFLAEVPGDAKRGTLKAMANSPEAIDSLRKKIEDAAPVWVLKDVDAEDEDEE